MTAPEQVEAANAVALWVNRVRASGDEVAFRHKVDGAWRAVTWKEADSAARELAHALIGAGVAPGDRIAILSQTRLEWMLTDAAALLCGAISVPIYASNTGEQCAFILNDSGARVLFVEDAAQLEKALEIKASVAGLQRIVYYTGDAALERPDAQGRTTVRLAEVLASAPAKAFPGLQSYADFRASGPPHATANPKVLDERTAAAGPDSTFTIIYTSGTTGNPKGVVLSHRNLTSALASACRAMKLFPQDVQLLCLPMAHVLGRELAWISVQTGLPSWFAEAMSKLKENLVDARPTFMAGVPRIFEKFYAGVLNATRQGSAFKKKLVAWALKVGAARTAAMRAGRAPGMALSGAIAEKLVFSKMRKRLGLDRCRFLISGGAPLAAEIGEFFHGVGLLILEGYGLTETMAAAFLNRLEKFKFGTVGPALDVVETKFADDGEILMRGPSVFKQYYNNAAATAEAIDGEGWFHSGDIGQFDDGCLRITDRKKDLIVTAGGKKVAPQPIENAIKARTTLVAQAMVYGDKRPYCVALLTPSEDAVKRFGNGSGHPVAESAELRAEIQKEISAMNSGLAPYESIKAFAILPAEFTEAAGEITPSLKVKRKFVIEKYQDAIEGLYRRPAASAD